MLTGLDQQNRILADVVIHSLSPPAWRRLKKPSPADRRTFLDRILVSDPDFVKYL